MGPDSIALVGTDLPFSRRVRFDSAFVALNHCSVLSIKSEFGRSFQNLAINSQTLNRLY